MMCYKDKTFCSFYNKCKDGLICDKALTEDIKKEAKLNNLPISQYMSEPECYKAKITIETKRAEISKPILGQIQMK